MVIPGTVSPIVDREGVPVEHPVLTCHEAAKLLIGFPRKKPSEKADPEAEEEAHLVKWFLCKHEFDSPESM